jgi:hypothetical protein
VNTTRKGTNHPVPREEIKILRQHLSLVKYGQLLGNSRFIYISVLVLLNLSSIGRLSPNIGTGRSSPTTAPLRVSFFSFPKEVTTVRCRIADKPQQHDDDQLLCWFVRVTD